MTKDRQRSLLIENKKRIGYLHSLSPSQNEERVVLHSLLPIVAGLKTKKREGGHWAKPS